MIDKNINISVAGSRKSTNWQTVSMQWSEFCQRLSKPVRSSETYAEYMAMKKSQQDELKDVGGFVGGSLSGTRRKAGCVTGRDLVTLDMDSIPAGGTEDVLNRVALLGCATAVYSTRKHSSRAPRLRIIIPLSRTVSEEEYEPLARKLCEMIGMQYSDPTTFEATRLMYWPSASSDGEYVIKVKDATFSDPDWVLSQYSDWMDVTSWPRSAEEGALEKRRLAKQVDPTTKDGVVGAFCRTYGILEAMDTFIPGIYEPTEAADRFTFTGGSTAGGAVIYDGLFLYSHHATDPCSGQLVNAWDLIRLHKFSDMDEEAKEGTPTVKLPSYKAMQELALSDQKVEKLLAKERLDKAKDAFSDETEPAEEPIEDWMGKLQLDGSGNYRKTIDNIRIILENDPRLKGKIVTDEFAGCGLAAGALPWDKNEETRRWTDNDDAGVQWYMETVYNIPSKDKILSALSIVGNQNRVNKVKEYLQSLKWDGVKRVDTLLQDYLGAEDNVYVRAVMRKSLAAAVSRAIEGGIKYDYMPIFAGPQGIGKSTFLATLGLSWFSDSLTTFEGKEAAEMIQGTWINEVGELNAMTKAETNAVKQFLSKRSDIYRAAYGRRTEEHPRRCVFFGTCNDMEFLKDTTGNRRF